MAEASRRKSGGVSLIPARVAGRYEPLAKIASGGMATVYLARAVTGAGFGKLVALKCVHPHMADQPEFVNMFLDEARIASRIDHPNVATVFDAGEDDGTRYLAMEYLHGEPVTALIKAWDAQEDARPERFCELVARIIADAAMGLHAAHELRGRDGALLNLVHRDVSPHNLFVTFDGSVKVVDFGIAKATGRLHETTTGVVKGKVAYMSPEQLHAEELDRRTDIWALGVTLWEMLTCRRLFKRGDQIATLNAVLEARVELPSKVDPRIPPELDRIAEKALTRDRDHRHATARELAEELNAFIASRGAHVGMGELADLMAETFRDEKVEKDAWVAQAREGRRTAPPGEPAAPTVEPTVSEVRPARVTATDPIELPVRHTGLWGIALLALLVGAAVAAAVMLLPEDDPPPAGPASAPDPDPEGALDPVTPTPEETGPTTVPIAEAEPDEPPPEANPPEPPPDPTPRPGADTKATPAPRRRAASRPAPAETAAPAPARPRDVRIVHPNGGWASLRVDGRAERNTPTVVPRLSVGRHVLEVRPYGRGAWQRRPIEVPAGGGPFVVPIPLPDP